MNAIKAINVLVLCTGNSARSILGEALFNHLGAGRVRAYSAGSQPSGRVNPVALETLEKHGVPLPSDVRSKSWDEFAAPGAPEMRIVITVCDSAAGEACPYWPCTPMTAHWGFPDPSHVESDDEARRLACARTAQAISHRLRLFLSLPMD